VITPHSRGSTGTCGFRDLGQRRFPRTRGDQPVAVFSGHAPNTISPHARGSTAAQGSRR